ncbi:4-(cytidine 5'-diphospho)-2-C-methyl-D-erythritol kinase [Brevundimonas sp.]|uniref:4-(cytidine 5'-diphospho)-2-C-methyl-D-erythritol kinase n=1 Tax=Brevundimonas sp. TaxID=1871086 RepID=UPI0025DD010D|nr:4-(cytidine 5'-diphospho)-2-C-methyl-D-erythritol kinase [Brevundimonas sp.]
MSVTELAPAKVNLFLHVGPPRADGRHPVCSLAVFADIGDTLEARPADSFSLETIGPFASEVGATSDNLVTRALAAVGAPPLAVRLEKLLPVASGLGGGSSDAGAALRLALRLSPDLGPEVAEAAARGLGADGLLCFRARTSLAEGEGEVLLDAPVLPVLPAVLVNPRMECPTGAVYRAYDEGPGRFVADRPSMPGSFETPGAVAAFLSSQRNDLEGPAIGLRPGIRDALDVLRRAPQSLLARMSGSGATVFALCADLASARQLADDVASAHPHWWVRACRLNPA